MNVLEAIQSKHAVRRFTDEPIPTNIMNTILEAGRRSQSSKNTQPWQFVLVTDREKLVALSQTGDFASHLAGAACAVVLVSPSDKYWHAFDMGQVATYLQLAAWELGVGTCIASIYRPSEARTILGIPDDMDCRVALSFGYPAPDHKPAKLGGRKPLDDIIHHNGW